MSDNQSNTNEQQLEMELHSEIDKSEMTLDRLVEQEMKEMNLDPQNEEDRQKFWNQKGLLG